MRTTLFLTLCVALAAGPLLAADHSAKEQALIKIVQSEFKTYAEQGAASDNAA